MTLAQTLAERLRKTREHYGWNAKTLAKQAQVPYETIYRAEKGIHDAPRLESLVKLAQALGVSLDYLAGLTDLPRPGTRLRQKESPHA